jgi:hypothetical protein
VAAIEVEAGDEPAAEAEGPGMDLSAHVFDPLYEDATLLLCQGRDRARVGPRSFLPRFDERGRGDILGSRIALASRSVIGTEVS